MRQLVSDQVLHKIRKLAALPDEARQCQFAVSITRLTVLKSLCHEPGVTKRFVTHLIRQTLQRVMQGQRHTRKRPPDQEKTHRQLMGEALAELEAWPEVPSEEDRQRLWNLLGRIQDEQNEHRRIKWGAVRIINDSDLLVFEDALRCVLHPHNSGVYAYQTARQYAERYDSSHGTGLIPASAPLVQDIVDFWMREFGLDSESLRGPVTARVSRTAKPTSASVRRGRTGRRKKARMTARQGQFLAFIHLYRKLHRQGPAELDLVRYFRVTPPSVHGMIVKLEQLGLVTREPGVARSVRVAVPEEGIPPLEEVAGPPW
jgi:Mn-dependent DtxR family transcriptional regulator